MGLPSFKTPFYCIELGASPRWSVFGSKRGRADWLTRGPQRHILEPGQRLGKLPPFRPEDIDWRTGTLLNGWERIEIQMCDLCPKRADWKHPLGGFRCYECPRPSS